MAEVILLMGGNIGDTELYLSRAVRMLNEDVGHVVVSSVEMESEPWGFDDVESVNSFLNKAVWITTRLKPEELLDTVQRIEREVGRDRASELKEREVSGERYASRVIDIDIIFYGDVPYQSERLTIPHPLMQEREFVLRPIVDIAPSWRHPILGRSCRELLDELEKM